MNKLVRKIGIKTVCDVYTCHNYAEFEVGHSVLRVACSHYCRDCMQTIVNEGTELLKEGSKTDNTEMSRDKSINDEVDSSGKDIISASTEQEYYVCKKCGAKFKKPDEVEEYKAHCMNAHRKDK